MRTLYGLVEVRPGEYRSRDGRYRIARDSASGRVRGGLGYNAWHVFSLASPVSRWWRVSVGDRREWETLRAAARDLGLYRANERLLARRRRS